MVLSTTGSLQSAVGVTLSDQQGARSRGVKMFSSLMGWISPSANNPQSPGV
jgi:hypothetical protein